MRKLKFGAIALVTALVLIVAPSAMAKGGTGGGGGGGSTCAKVESLSATPGYDDLGNPGFTLAYAISTTCFDERPASYAVDTRNEDTGFTTRAFAVLSPGLTTVGRFSPGTPGTRLTITVTAYLPNGNVADSRTTQVTVPDALVPAA